MICGTVNENGCLLIKATHIGSETALSQIVQIVEAAQLARAPVQKLADRISRFFVPAVSSFVYEWVLNFWYSVNCMPSSAPMFVICCFP